MEYQKIVKLEPKDLIWTFEGGNPYYYVKSVLGKHAGRAISVDPFPCLTHNVDLLKSEIEKVEASFKTDAILRWALFNHEVSGHVNAWASSEEIWGDDVPDELIKKHKIQGIIAMSGKRTMVHPAMTKYLVAHEYGHIVDYWITACMKEEQKCYGEPFRDMYAKMRNISSDNMGYGGARWLGTIGEVIADDFRIVVAGVDQDFFIHSTAGVKHPCDCVEVKDFWNEMKEKYQTSSDICQASN